MTNNTYVYVATSNKSIWNDFHVISSDIVYDAQNLFQRVGCQDEQEYGI